MNATDDIGIRVSVKDRDRATSDLKQVEAAQKGLTEQTKQHTGAAKENTAAVKQQAAAHRESEGTAASLMRTLGSVRGLLATMGVGTVFTMATAFTLANDEAKVTLARINGITQSLSESRAQYRGLYEDALRLRAPQQDTLQGYVRIAGAVKELGGTLDQARKINEAVIATAKISGVSSQEAGAAARQFAQALGSGVLQGDELRSLLENMPQLAQALARELGVGIGQLRQMGSEGKLTADVVFPALLRASEKISGEFLITFRLFDRRNCTTHRRRSNV
jgi:tape measure domain-containing protein